MSGLTSKPGVRVLNLYAGIGGNRKLWEGVDVTAIESDPNIATIYHEFFPDDEVIMVDAHQYLLDHYDDGWDFIWSSPPCPTHSRIRAELSVSCGQNKPVYPDMKLYEEIIFLTYYSRYDKSMAGVKWVVENVNSFYEPLIKPHVIDNHFIWSNANITEYKGKCRHHHKGMAALEKYKGFDLSSYSGIDKRKILRNCVAPSLGRHIFNCAFKVKQTTLDSERTDLQKEKKL